MTYWYLIVDTTEGIKAFGPFNQESDAIDFVYSAEKIIGQPIGYFDTWPSQRLDADQALAEWYKSKGG